MGQAKQRRDAVESGAPRAYRDLRDGGMKWGRTAPSIREMFNLTLGVVAAEMRGERPVVSVPCNGCTACCHMPKINFWIAEERPEDLAHLDYEIDPENSDQALMRHKDGACIHLGPKGCTVYEHRPRCCRVFDCRFFAIAGIYESYDDGSHWPIWVSEENSEADRIDRAAMSAALQMEAEKAQADGEEWDYATMGQRVWTRTRELIPVMKAAAEKFKTLPAALREKLAEGAWDDLSQRARKLHDVDGR